MQRRSSWVSTSTWHGLLAREGQSIRSAVSQAPSPHGQDGHATRPILFSLLMLVLVASLAVAAAAQERGSEERPLGGKPAIGPAPGIGTKLLPGPALSAAAPAKSANALQAEWC